MKDQGRLKPHARIYVESEPELQVPDWFHIIRHGQAGKVKFMLTELL